MATFSADGTHWGVLNG